MDGTAVDVTGIRHYLDLSAAAEGRRRRADYTAFHAASALMPPHVEVLRIMHWLHDAGIALMVTTARSERWRYLSEVWLGKWGAPPHAMWMRRWGDLRRDREVKRDILRQIERTHEVVLTVDDNPDIVALWREEGLPVVRVPGWAG